MSLLNEMLRDLASKKEGNSKPSFLFKPSINQVSSSKSINIIYWIAAFLLMGELLYLTIGKKPTEAPPVQQESKITPPVTLVSVIPPINIAKPSALIPIPDVLSENKAVEEDANDIEKLDQNAEVLSEIEDTDNANIIRARHNAIHATDESQNPIYKNFSLNSNEWYEIQLDKALESIENGNEIAGMERLKLIMSKFPASEEVREALSGIYLSQNNIDEASLIIDEGLEFQPRSLNLTMMKARVLMQENKNKEALQLLQKLNPDIQAEPDYYGLLAAVLESLGRSIEAGSIYQTLVEVDPGNGQYWLGFAIALEQKNSQKQAISAYRHAMESYSVKPEIRAFAENRLRNLQG